MDPSTSTAISCYGPCRKRFRPASISMDQNVANLLLAPGVDSGLRWLCPGCRQSDDGPELASKIPPELWKLIFRYLDKRSKLRVRLICHRWKDIFDSSTLLRNGFRMDFERNMTMDDRYYPENLFPATIALLSNSEIITVDAWWPPFGCGLTELILSDCEMGLSTLLGMLKETPNLVHLDLGETFFTSVEDTEVNFRLENLKVFRSDTLFDDFIQMFPHLTILNVRYIPVEDDEKMCRLLQSVQGTLTELICYLTPFAVEQIATMNKLRLSKVTCNYDGDGDSLVKFSQIQPSIEELNINVDNAVYQVLNEIGRNLTKLKSLRVEIDSEVESFETSFLAKMPLITQLRLAAESENEHQHVNFERCNSPNLVNLQLNSLRFFAGSLQHYLTNCSHIQEISLSSCSLDSWSDIFAAQFKSLRYLFLCGITVNQNTASLPNRQFNTLKHIRINMCDIPQELLTQIVLQCPTVEQLAFSFVDSINDEFVQVLNRLPQLKKLTLSNDNLTDNSVLFIVKNCPNLRADIFSYQISKVALNRLKAMAQSR